MIFYPFLRAIVKEGAINRLLRIVLGIVRPVEIGKHWTTSHSFAKPRLYYFILIMSRFQLGGQEEGNTQHSNVKMPSQFITGN